MVLSVAILAKVSAQPYFLIFSRLNWHFLYGSLDLIIESDFWLGLQKHKIYIYIYKSIMHPKHFSAHLTHGLSFIT